MFVQDLHLIIIDLLTAPCLKSADPHLGDSATHGNDCRGTFLPLMRIKSNSRRTPICTHRMSSQTDSTISRVDLGITALSHLIMKIENIYHIRVTGNRLQKVSAQKGALAKTE